MRRYIGFWVALLIAGLPLLSSMAAAQQAPNIIGKWTGTVDDKGLPVPIFVTISSLAPGQPAGEVKFTTPHQCERKITYGGFSSGVHVFYGNLCSNWANVAFKFRATPNGNLVLDAYSGNEFSEKKYSVILNAQK